MKLKTLAFIAAGSVMSVSAYAQTEYDLDITNTANLSYTSGTDSRTAVSDPVVFKVDRKVIFNLSGTNTDQTVAPGDTTYSQYTLTNSSNAPIDYSIAKPIDTNVTYIIDVNNDGLVDAGDTRITSGDSAFTIPLTTADGVTPTKTIFVEVVTAANAVDGNSTTYNLQAKAVEPVGSTIGAPGADIVPTPDSTVWAQNTVQTVVDNSAVDADDQGILRTETGTFTVGAANITLIKAVKVIKDPITGDLDEVAGIYPKAIPGATVQYTLTVKNTGHAPATVQLTDLLSENFLKTNTITSVLVDGLAPGTTPTLVADTTASGFNALLTVPDVTVIAVPADDIPAEQNTVVTFEVVLN
jgi:uncharacterized repeat protein (TIGR01451 family)